MTGSHESLDPRYVQSQRLAGWIMFAVVMLAWAMATGVVFATGEAGLRWVLRALAAAGAIAAPLLIWLATAWPALSYRNVSYRIDDAGIEIRSGVWFKRITTVPRSRVQHTDVGQGPIERRYGLGHLVIYTAGTEFARVVLPGLAHERALAIRDTLLPHHGADAV